MPFRSQQQRKWMYANNPEMAKKWEKHTPKNKKLPKKVKKKSSSILYGLCNYFYKAANVVDVSDKFHQKQISNKLQNAVPEPTEVAKSPELDIARQRAFHKQVKEAVSVWQHRFSNVRKDSNGFFISKSDSPNGKDIKVGDLLADDQMNMTPYWEVASNVGSRIGLKPIGSNPFLTGVGAGGAKLTDYDISVFTGEREKTRAKRVQEMLEAGTASIDDVKYILLGTVPVHMGPNGAQGGWYSVEDRHNRGGAKGLSAKQIMMADAKRLKELGFEVPRLALSGELSAGQWSSWMEGDAVQNFKYIPKNVDSYVDFHKKMTDKGKWKYDAENLEEIRRSLSVEKMEAFWDSILEDFLTLPKEEFKKKHEFLPDNLKGLIEFREHHVDKVRKALDAKDELQTENEDDTEQSILKNIFSSNDRVSRRNIIKLIEMCKEDDSRITYLHDFIKNGGAKDYLSNEKVLNFFDITDDIEGLRLGIEHLTDPTNRRYAYDYLLHHGDVQFAEKHVSTETSMEAIKGFLGSFVDANMSSYGVRLTDENRKSIRDKDKASLKELIQICERNDLLTKIEQGLRSEDVYEKHYSGEALGAIRSGISRLGLAYLDEEEIQKHFSDLYDFVKKIRELSKIK